MVADVTSTGGKLVPRRTMHAPPLGQVWLCHAHAEPQLRARQAGAYAVCTLKGKLASLQPGGGVGGCRAPAEPILEAWRPPVLEARSGAAGRALALTSRQRQALTPAPAAFRSVGDVKCFAEALARTPRAGRRLQPGRPSVAARSVARGVARWLAATLGRMARLYRCFGALTETAKLVIRK